jgi:hypothetical protein
VMRIHPVRNGSLSRKLLRGAAEAPLGGLALGERGRVANRLRVFHCAVVPWGGSSVVPTCHVVGLEARNHCRPGRTRPQVVRGVLRRRCRWTKVLAAGGEERLPRRGLAREASCARVGCSNAFRAASEALNLCGIGQRDPASGLSGSQLVLEDVCILSLLPWVADPLRRRSIESSSTLD